MSKPTDTPEFRAWLASRPDAIRKLAAEFPLGMEIAHNGVTLTLIGYGEAEPTNTLFFSPIDPAINFEAAQRHQVAICPEHLRNGEVRILNVVDAPHIVIADEAMEQMASDPEIAEALREFSAILRQAWAGVRSGQYKDMDEALFKLTGHRPEKIDLDEAEDVLDDPTRH